jgi:hypothetical protein
MIDASEFVEDDINNDDESNGSDSKLRLSKIPKENNSGIGKGWAKEKGGGTTTSMTAMARRDNNGGGGGRKAGGVGGAMKLG